MKGTVARVIQDRGFCFVHQDGDGPDLFAHVKDFSPELAFDETLHERRVAFEVAESDKGPKAVNVRPI